MCICSQIDFDPQEIARQITLIDHKLLRGVKLREMLKVRWTKKQAPTIDIVGERINKVFFSFFLLLSSSSPRSHSGFSFYSLHIGLRLLLSMRQHRRNVLRSSLTSSKSREYAHILSHLTVDSSLTNKISLTVVVFVCSFVLVFGRNE
jgi:hypothetical protein